MKEYVNIRLAIGGGALMNIAICEDDASDVKMLCSVLDGYMARNGYLGDIRTFNSGEALLVGFSEDLYDIIFLDIYMGGITGIDTAKKIREVDATCAIVFITSSADHSLESYSVRGCAYVVKPIRDKEMQTALFQCREIFMRNARFIEVRCDRLDVKLPLVKIYHAESFDKYVKFSTSIGEYTSRITLDEVERRLGGKPFYRCHQSCIVNTNHIVKLSGGDILMKNEDVVPIRKNGREGIRMELAAILSSRMFEA